MRPLNEMIHVMKAFNDGIEIECRIPTAFDSSWKPCKKPEWNWQNADYRIRKTGFRYELMTNRQLAELLAKGYGEWRYDDGNECHTTYSYDEDDQDKQVDEDIIIRSWREDDWKIPLQDIYSENVLNNTERSY